MTFELNYLSVLVAGIVGMGIGAFWYSPLLFGTHWMRLMKFTPESMAAAKAKGMGKTYAIAFIGELLTAYILAHFLNFPEPGVGSALSMTFWAWLGFIVPVMAGQVLWDNKSWNLFFINAAQRLVSLLAMAAIIAAWI